jgi:hypothetical protein
VPPCADQHLAPRRSIVAALRFQLKIVIRVAYHPVIPDRPLVLQPENPIQFRSPRCPPVVDGASVVLPDRLQYLVLQWNTNSPVHTVEKKFRWCWTCPSAAKPTLKTAKYAANQSKSALPSKRTNSPASLLRPLAKTSRNHPNEVNLHICVNRT